MKYFDTVKIDIGLQTIVECPYLEVDISTPILRRCFNNTYSVHYCNQGTAVAKDAYVEVKLDKWLKYVSSTRPLSSQLGNILRYDLGDIPISDCGDFQIVTYLDCDSTLLGQTHCTEAHIFPDSLCLPTNGWDGSRIRVSGQCLGDSIQFEIKNASNSPMLQQSEYIVVEDEIIMMQKPFQLGANESLRFNMPVFGRTYRLEAAQSVGHPGSSKPSVTIENCGVGPVSLGFVNQFHQDDADPFIDIDCQQNRGSYDPNDKQGFPTGYGKSHFVEQNQQIEYLIRFQNTGTDTAFTVRIHDTLSTHLDPTSFVGGASSHPYSYRIFDNGIIEFLFSAIALPDSNINKSGSIGFVKFTIAQRKDLPLGTEIKNRAAIYFDYNSPILTNTTIHTIGKNFITITEIPEINTSNLRIYPNPFSQETVIEWEGNNIDEKVFELYDLQGRQLRKEKFTDNRLNFKRNQLQNGLYFFKITDKNGILTQGKMVVD
ncbi:MAG: T9SS type A sorting domain-containing protein [Saprospiraceae bacterium]|nr:T9SS type A sorting domain-containing protein [Saprospiraceae bacterium]